MPIRFLSNEMARIRGSDSGSDDGTDEFGFDRDPSVFTRGFEKLVPSRLARWALDVSVETDDETYHVGETVEITVSISNRLPVPVEVPIYGRRVWGWSVDGFVDASDEPLYTPDRPRSLSFRAGETRTFTRDWHGRIKRNGTPTRWEEVPKGEYEIVAFVSTDPPTRDSTSIRLE
jgi:hypothetical protein